MIPIENRLNISDNKKCYLKNTIINQTFLFDLKNIL